MGSACGRCLIGWAHTQNDPCFYILLEYITQWVQPDPAGIILGMGSASGRCLIGWAHTQNDPCFYISLE